MRIKANEGSSQPEQKEKTYYEIKVTALKHVNDTYMFFLKNITTLKELEQNRTTHKMNKLAYYQITHELLTPINSMMSMIELLKLT